MKLIFEKIAGQLFAYRETESHFKRVEATRTTPLLEVSDLDDDCGLDGRDDFHLVVDICTPPATKRKQPRKRGKTTPAANAVA